MSASETRAAAARPAAAGDWRSWVLPGLLLLVLALAYAETARSFVAIWSGRDDYSHGFLVPLVSLYLAWARRDRLRATRVRPDYALGGALLGLGCALLVAGKVGAFVAAEQTSVLLVVPGLVLLLWGRAMLGELLFPVTYLVLMVPAAIDPLISRLHWPLQLFGAACASSLIRLAGIPVVRDQQFLALPNVTLEVADICSGVRYLISIIALSLPLAHLMLRRTRQRVLLVLAALVIGISANPLRIALIGAWVYHRGAAQVHGPGHVLHGFFVSLVGFAFLFLAATLISWGDRGKPGPAAAPPARPAPGPAGAEARRVAPWAVALVLVALTAGAVRFYRPLPVPLPGALALFPVAVGQWRGEAVSPPASPLRLAAADAELERLYRTADGRQARLYLGYLEAQSQGRELVYYTSQRVYDRSTGSELVDVAGRTFSLSAAVVPIGGGLQAVCYWYEVGGRSAPSPLRAKIETALQGLARRRTDGTIVAVSREVGARGEAPAALEELRAFAREAQPLIAGLLRGGAGTGGAP